MVKGCAQFDEYLTLKEEKELNLKQILSLAKNRFHTIEQLSLSSNIHT